MRIYHLGNSYMSAIQQGIQAAHCQMEMFLKYNVHDQASNQDWLVTDWAQEYKTMICLNGGANKELHEFKSLCESEDNPYPWAYFNEEEDAMARMLTNVAIIIPERLYGQRERLRKGETILYNGVEYEPTDIFYDGQPNSEVIYEFTDFEIKLMNTLNYCRLA